MKRFLTVAVFGMLFLGSGAIFIFRQTSAQSPSKATLYEDMVPGDIPGWRVKDLPLADTDLGIDATRDILEFDAVVHRSFRRGDIEITFFLLYWSPAKNVLPRRIAFHSPDNCWRESGFERIYAEDNSVLQVAETSLIPGYLRTFEFKNKPIHVYFWQLWGSEPVYYLQDGNPMPSDWSLVTDLFKGRLYEKQHQLYLRFSSTVPFSKLEREGLLAPFETVFKELELSQ